MTYEEAIKYLSGLPPYCEDCEFNLNECDGLGHDCKIAEANRIGIEALKKQIPKKPINKTGLNNTTAHLYENCSIVVCPECRGRLKLKSKGKCCDKCGQAIDWSERMMISGDGFDGTQKTKGGEKTMANGETATINGERTGTTMIVMLCPKCESRQVFVVDGKEHYCTNCGEKLNEQ